jgi:periplasmic protein CpxP/Spy
MLRWFARVKRPASVAPCPTGHRRLKWWRASLALAVFVGLAGLSAAVPAQAPPPASPDEQFTQLKQRLAITPPQEAKFAALVAAMQQNTATRDAFVARNPPSVQRDALQELRVQAEAASLDARGLQRLLPAFQALYLSLSPQQKAAADQAFAPPPQGPPEQMPPQGR